MANQEELSEAVYREYKRFRSARLVYCYETGYAGRGVASNEMVSAEALDAASKDAALRVERDGIKASVRVVKTFVGNAPNEWSILIVMQGSSQPAFNFRVAVG